MRQKVIKELMMKKCEGCNEYHFAPLLINGLCKKCELKQKLPENKNE